MYVCLYVCIFIYIRTYTDRRVYLEGIFEESNQVPQTHEQARCNTTSQHPITTARHTSLSHAPITLESSATDSRVATLEEHTSLHVHKHLFATSST